MISISPRGVSLVSCVYGSPRLASVSDLALFKLLLMCWDSEHVRFCVCPLNVEIILYSPPSWMQAHWPSEPESYGLNSWCRRIRAEDSQAGEPYVGLRLLLPWWILYNCHILTFGSHLPWGVFILTILHIHPCYQLWKIFSALLQVILTDSFSVNIVYPWTPWECTVQIHI